MLVLSRRQHQRIRLGDSIVVTVVRVSGDKVRLGIEAPKNMLILREELELHHDPERAEAENASLESVELVADLRAAS
jgi:carbon storage regulator